MSTTPEGGEAKRRHVMAFVAYGIILVLLGSAGVALWTAERGGRPDLASSRRTAPAASKTTQIDEPRQDRGQGATVGSAGAVETAPAKKEPQQETAVVAPPPPQSETTDKAAAAPTSQKPEPATAPALAKCTLDPVSWPTDRTEQAKAIQILLRDLGFYGGTTYGTLGPTTRAAIRKYQLDVGEAETGEPSEMLFESLKKKCAP
ncbi:Putative peptidoglycan binding domain-containing protein [Rhodospirillales bacterium URHD0017]|nr:Putative peptidoglycan binding domain-containing protein [Rhodospirillales bacterium URHD0017]